MNKMGHIHTIEYYLRIKRSDVLIHGTTWMNLEDILLSKRNHSQRNSTCCSIPFICNVQNMGLHSDRKQIGGCLEFRKEEESNSLIEKVGIDCQWLWRVSFMRCWKWSKINCGDICKTMFKYFFKKAYGSNGWILWYVISISTNILKWVSFIECLLCIEYYVRKFFYNTYLILWTKSKLRDVKGLTQPGRSGMSLSDSMITKLYNMANTMLPSIRKQSWEYSANQDGFQSKCKILPTCGNPQKQ